jgi:hypothetical protein
MAVRVRARTKLREKGLVRAWIAGRGVVLRGRTGPAIIGGLRANLVPRRQGRGGKGNQERMMTMRRLGRAERVGRGGKMAYPLEDFSFAWRGAALLSITMIPDLSDILNFSIL